MHTNPALQRSQAEQYYWESSVACSVFVQPCY